MLGQVKSPWGHTKRVIKHESLVMMHQSPGKTRNQTGEQQDATRCRLHTTKIRAWHVASEVAPRTRASVGKHC